MTIDEAIKMLELDKRCEFEGDSLDLEEARQMGIEALKHVKMSRDPSGVPEYPLLPGETIE